LKILSKAETGSSLLEFLARAKSRERKERDSIGKEEVKLPLQIL
jgi:hypothetical protein